MGNLMTGIKSNVAAGSLKNLLAFDVIGWLTGDSACWPNTDKKKQSLPLKGPILHRF